MSATSPSPVPTAYPARLEVDHSAQYNRVTTLFRVVLIIPIGIVYGVLTAGATQTAYTESGKTVTTTSGGIAAGLFLATLLMILFRQRYPRWWFDFALELARFGTRIGAYLALLTDQYPSTVEEQDVHLEIDYPDVERDLNRWLPLVKWLLAIPHYFVLFFLTVGAFFAASSPGSRSCSPDAIRGGCSTSWSASAGGGCAWRHMRSSSSPTGIPPSHSAECRGLPRAWVCPGDARGLGLHPDLDRMIGRVDDDP